MSGICAGRRGKVNLGDVIFADRLWSYDAGKVEKEDGKDRFQGDMLQFRPDPVWVQRMQAVTIPSDAAWLGGRRGWSAPRCVSHRQYLSKDRWRGFRDRRTCTWRRGSL